MTYIKPFDTWNIEKKNLQNSPYAEDFFPKIREIFYTKLGINLGFESDGKKKFIRPVIILAKIGGLYWVAPLTSKLKENFFHHTLKSVSFKDVDYSVVMLSQAKVIDKKRLLNSIGMISIKEFNQIQKKMKNMYFPSL